MPKLRQNQFWHCSSINPKTLNRISALIFILTSSINFSENLSILYKTDTPTRSHAGLRAEVWWSPFLLMIFPQWCWKGRASPIYSSSFLKEFLVLKVIKVWCILEMHLINNLLSLNYCKHVDNGETLQNVYSTFVQIPEILDRMAYSCSKPLGAF